MDEPTILVCFIAAVTTCLAAVILGYLIYLFFKEGGDE